MKKYYAYQIDTLRLFAMVTIFANHSIFIETRGEYGEMFFDKFMKIGMSGFDFFMILSGMLSVYFFKDFNIKDKGQYLAYAKKRAMRIYPTHWFCMLLFLPLSFAFHGTAHTLSALVPTALLIQGFIPKIYLYINGPTWTLSDLLLLFMVIPCMMPLIRRLKRLWTCFAAILVLLYIGQYFLELSRINLFEDEYMNYFIFQHSRIFEVIAGMILGHMMHIFKYPAFIKNHATFFEFLTLGGLIATVVLRYRYYFVTEILTVFLIYVFFAGNGWISKFLSIYPFRVVGKISFSFYMIHYLVINIFLYLSTRVWHNFETMTFHEGVIVTIASLIVSIISSWLLYTFVEKRLTSYFSKRLNPKPATTTA